MSSGEETTARAAGPSATVPGAPAPGGGALARLLRRGAGQREAALLIFIVGFGLVMTVLTPTFLTAANLRSVVLGLAINGIVAVGMTVLLASGGFDLSVGSVLALGGMIAGSLVLEGVPAPVAVLAALGGGAFIGAINGVFVARLGINPLIQTLGMLSVVRGLVLLLGGGFGVSNLPDSYTPIGQSEFLTLQLPIWFMLVIAILGDFLLRRSRVGRLPYYVGGNERAARLTGIPVDRVKIAAYMLTGTLAALGGVITAARFGSASVSAGTGLELQVIAAVVIGGASLSGGSGTVLGSLLGLLLTQLIVNALNLLAFDVYYQPIAIGLVLIIAVGVDAFTRRERKPWRRRSR